MAGPAEKDGKLAKIFVLVLLAFTAYLLYWVFQPFLSAITWAIFLATAFYPMHVHLMRLLKGRGMLAAILSTTIVAAVIVVPLCFIVIMVTRSVTEVLASLQIPVLPAATTSEALAGPAAGSDTSTVLDAVAGGAASAPTISSSGATGSSDQSGEGAIAPPDAVVSAPEDHARGLSPAMAAAKRRIPLLVDIERFASRYVDVSAFDIQGTAFTALQRIGSFLAVTASNLVQNVLWTLVMFAIMIFTMIYLFREGPSILAAFKSALPLSETDRDAMFARLHAMTDAVFYGVFMTSAVQGLLGGVGWWVVGLPSPLTAGFAMFFFSLLPTGTVLIWGPGVVYLFIQGHVFKALILAVWGIAIVGTIDNFLRPYFISGRTQMHSLLVFFGVLGGLAAYGIGGLFLGPLLITLFLFLVEVLQRDSGSSAARPATRGLIG